MPRKVEVSDEIYVQRRPNRTNLFDCLKEIGTDWQFVPGPGGDFMPPSKDPAKLKRFRVNFISRVRQYFIDKDLRPKHAFKYAWQDDGSVVIRAYERTPEELAEYERREQKRLKTRAEKRMRAEGLV